MANDFKKYPYQDYNSFNLDWIIEHLKTAEEFLKNIDENISQVVVDTLTEWLNDGTLADLITDQVLTQIQQNTDDIADLQTSVNYLAGVASFSLVGKKALLIGDSYLRGTGSGSVPEDLHGWGYYLENKSGMICYSMPNSGAGFVNQGHLAPYSGMNFLDMLEQANTDIADKDDYSYVICLGGINDVSTGVNPATNVRSFIQRARTYFRNANVVVFPLHCDSVPTHDRMVCYGRVYRAALLEGAMTTFEAIYWLMRNADMGYGDDNHPNAWGYQNMGYYILSFLYGGNPVYQIGPGVITPGTDFELVDLASLVERTSNRVHINGVLHNAGSISSGQIIAKIGANFAPGQRIWFPVYLFTYSGDRVVSMAYLTANSGSGIGEIVLAPGTIGGVDATTLTDFRVYIDLNYIINNL